MGRVLIENERLRVVLTPEIGAGVAEFSMRAPGGEWRPVWRPAPEHATHFNELACYVLAPWSNRIAGARFDFEGRPIALRADWPDGTAIHGVVKDRAWTVLDRSPVSARFGLDARQFNDLNWPWPFTATARYELDDATLRMEVAVRNQSDSAMPAGLGFHPYFMRKLWDERDDVVLRAALAGRYPAAGMIPTGPARPDEITVHLAEGKPLRPLRLDDVFAGFDRGASVTWPASGVRATFEASPSITHTVIYSPQDDAGVPRPHFCVEPVTMVNDGFNLMSRGAAGTGVEIVAPGATLNAMFAVRIDGPSR